VLLHLASAKLRLSRVLWFQVIYQQPNPGIKYEYMLPMQLGDLTPAMMSVPSVSRTVADNGVIAPPLLLPPGTLLPRTRPRKGNMIWDSALRPQALGEPGTNGGGGISGRNRSYPGCGKDCIL
jgi:hypothetical protein